MSAMTLICEECGALMIRIGREIKPGHSEIWIDAWVCPTPRCNGYGSIDYQGRVMKWPAMTLVGEVPLHARIQGARYFRDGGYPWA